LAIRKQEALIGEKSASNYLGEEKMVVEACRKWRIGREESEAKAKPEAKLRRILEFESCHVLYRGSRKKSLLC
jgi:hypothetical protein